MRRIAGVKPIRLAHQDTGTDQEVAEAGPRRDAAMPMMRRIGRGQEARVLPFARHEDALPRHEHVVEHDDACRLAETGAELRRVPPWPADRARGDGATWPLARPGPPRTVEQ